MDYKTKVKLMEESVSKIQNGTSLEQIKAALSEQGFKSTEIFTVVASIKKQLKEEYGEKIEKSIVNGDADNVYEELPHLEKDVVDEIKQESLNSLRSKLTIQARKLLATDMPEEQVVLALTNEYTSPQEIQEILAKAKLRTVAQEEESKGSMASVGLGVLMLVGGLVLTAATDRIWYGLMIVGVVAAVKGLIKS